jgi:hypothetical protein
MTDPLKRRDFLHLGTLGAAAGASGLFGGASRVGAGAPAKQPAKTVAPSDRKSPSMNIVMIVIDTLRYDYVRANGNEAIQTPNLDRLVAKSWNFHRAFTGSFPTIPNRTDLITARYCSARPLGFYGTTCDAATSFSGSIVSTPTSRGTRRRRSSNDTTRLRGLTAEST